ncbi:SurA N-terminal domain-containing protein [Candidatus Saccharibacteria bacterium]|nr:SurA N-terminal domain-containing protein [Candidatus Saccharibacteria bacterium]
MKKLSLRKKADQQPKTEKEKVEERKKEVLAQGRKFKYPIQYAKHNVVIITIVVSVIAVALLVLFGWLDFYKFQDSGDIAYRISRFLPLYVADVDDEKVRFSDYLMIYRSSLKAVEQQSGKLGNDTDADSVRDEYKQTALDSAEKYTFALKLAKENGIEVSDEEVNEAFDSHRKVGGAERSEEAFLKVINDNFGFSKDEYTRLLYLSLIREKVEERIDENATKLADEIEKALTENGGDYMQVAEQFGDRIIIEETGGLVDNKNIDGGRANVASRLKEGEQSGRFVSNNGDGIYFLKLISKNETQVNYISIKISFTEFEKRFEEIKNSQKITEYIEIRSNE